MGIHELDLDYRQLRGMDKVEQLRANYPSVTYQNYQMEILNEQLHVSYQYEITDLDQFTTKWVFPLSSNFQKELIYDPLVNQLVLSLGLVELLSYWKMTCSPIIRIEAGNFNSDQLKWWKKLLMKGMGEYFYRNGISIEEKELVTFYTVQEKETDIVLPSSSASFSIGNGVLIPVGGGKDSIVTLDILKHYQSNVKSFIINPRQATLQTAVIAGIEEKDTLCVNRSFDSKMLSYNALGFLNGHTPFSALVAFSSVLSAYLNDCRYVALSNESSANEATVAGTDVNHQYSKSFEFESDFSFYLNQYISADLHYFSFLRPLSEYQIGKYFAKLTPYHGVFRSCNLGSKHDAWCNNCAKCLYVYVLLSAFLSSDSLVNIFGENLLERVDMIPIFDSLIGKLEEKPFECVGSIDEINVALHDAINSYHQNQLPLPYLLSYYKTTSLYEWQKGQINPYHTYYNEEHHLPAQFLSCLKKEFQL